ncbi:MAG: sialidase family protein [Bryobacteraceae bacterium]
MMTRRLFTGAMTASALYGVDALSREPLKIELGPERLVAPGVPWPYLFQGRGGATVVFGHVRWPQGGKYPIHYITRSFDGRKSWQELKQVSERGKGPLTEGATVQLRDGTCLLFDVHCEHVGSQRFEAHFWPSRDEFRTLEKPELFSFEIPQADTGGFDDRGEPVSRVYLRRSVEELPNGDLLATAYSRFKEDKTPIEYEPKMNKVRSWLMRSSDKGRTWRYVSTIAAEPVEQEGFAEPVMVRLTKGKAAGRLICQMRTGRENPIYQCESDDEGLTWTRAYPLRWTYSRWGRYRDIVGADPDLCEMSDGTLAMAYGHKPDYRDHGSYVAFSIDQGHSWLQVTQVSAGLTMAYCGIREVAPGELYVVYTTTDEPQVSRYREAKFNTMGRSIYVKHA